MRTARPNLQVVEGQQAEGAFEAWSGFVAALAHRLLGSDVEVDDVVQDVFLVALDGLGRLRRSEAARPWLATLTVRTVGRRLRRRKIATFFGLDALPVAERLAWSLHLLEENTLEEVAERCGCSLATAKRRIAAAQKKLSGELDGLD